MKYNRLRTVDTRVSDWIIDSIRREQEEASLTTAGEGTWILATDRGLTWFAK